MRISLGADHGGVELKDGLKAILLKKHYELTDHGAMAKEESIDYPLLAEKVVKDLQSKKSDYGILFCKTGMGMQLAANHYRGIRAALVNNLEMARFARLHNNANILCFGSMFISLNEAIACTLTGLDTPFAGDRHQRRLLQIPEAY